MTREESMNVPATTSGKVLVVDDEPTIVDLVGRMLRRTGLEVFGVNSGEAAVEAMREHRPIVVLTDKNLPGIGGLDVVRAGRTIIPDAQFILMTGYASLDSALVAIELGVIAYITKPFTRSQLTEQVVAAAEHVHKKQVTQQTLERMRAATSNRITGPIAIREGIDELDDVVHKLERLVASLTNMLSDAKDRRGEVADTVGELSELINRLSAIKGQLPEG